MILIKFFPETISPSVSFREYSHNAGLDLLKQAVKRKYSLDISENDIAYEAHGKPYFKEYPVCFNISHCKRFAVCGISDNVIGIDCEQLRPVYPKVMKRMFSESEANAVLSSDNPSLAFTVLWTLKESYGKYTGLGISAIKDIAFDINNSAVLTRSGCDFNVVIINQRYVFSVCQKGNNKISIKMEDFDIDFCDIIEYNI